MTYLSGARAWREVAATLWLMLLAAGLLATSAVDDGNGGGGVSWSGKGPEVTLSPAEPIRAFTVRLVVPNLADAAEASEATWSTPLFAWVSLEVGSRFAASSSASGSGGEGGEVGVTTAPAGTPWPWIIARMKDSSRIVTQSEPFLTEWSGGVEVAFSGNCAAPDPEGADPCVASFTVEFEVEDFAAPGTSEISWNVDASMNLPGLDQELIATVKIQPL